MRELKFRAWDKKRKCYAERIQTHNTSCPYHDRMNMPKGVMTFSKWLLRRYIIEQYTGIKDENGKEIYEGDVVEALIDGAWKTGRNTVGFGKAKWRLEVLYNDIRFMDVFHVIGSKNCSDRIYYLFDKELSDIKVIGNIHENADLLEEENNPL